MARSYGTMTHFEFPPPVPELQGHLTVQFRRVQTRRCSETARKREKLSSSTYRFLWTVLSQSLETCLARSYGTLRFLLGYFRLGFELCFDLLMLHLISVTTNVSEPEFIADRQIADPRSRGVPTSASSAIPFVIPSVNRETHSGQFLMLTKPCQVDRHQFPDAECFEKSHDCRFGHCRTNGHLNHDSAIGRNSANREWNSTKLHNSVLP